MRWTALCVSVVVALAGCVTEPASVEEAGLSGLATCSADESVNGVCPTCRADSPSVPQPAEDDGLPTETREPDPGPNPGAPPSAWFALTGNDLRAACNNPPAYPENAGETCTNQSGWGRWLMCHRKNTTQNPYRGGNSCRRWPQWVKDRCASVGADDPVKKIKCFIDEMQNWLGHGFEVCDEASSCLLSLVRDLGWDCHRERSDTHAWVVCTIGGVRHVFDGNNGAYYSCQ